MRGDYEGDHRNGKNKPCEGDQKAVWKGFLLVCLRNERSLKGSTIPI